MGRTQKRKLANILIGLLSLWAVYIIVVSLFNITILFPFTITTSEEVPDFRLYTIRLAIFGTFAFYGIKHLLRGSSTVYPIHFLKTFLFFSVVGVCVGRVNPEWLSVTDLGLIAFFFWVAITLHLASLPQHRRYFKN